MGRWVGKEGKRKKEKGDLGHFDNQLPRYPD